MTTTSNPGEVPLPYYSGHHFYFTLPHDQRAASSIELPRTEMRRQLDGGAISEATPGAPRYTLDNPEIIDRFHCLTGPSEQPVRLVRRSGDVAETVADERNSWPACELHRQLARGEVGRADEQFVLACRGVRFAIPGKVPATGPPTRRPRSAQSRGTKAGWT